MNETITTNFNVIFHLRNEREKHELLPIYARITINGKRIELSSKQMMNPNGFWLLLLAVILVCITLLMARKNRSKLIGFSK